jgi:hypothetical protein
MSSLSDLDLDLEKLFQPAWAQEKPAGNRFEKFTGNEGARPDRRGGGPRRESFGERRDNRPRSGGKFGGKKDFPRRDDRDGRRERPEPPPPLPELAVTFVPDEHGVESIARQIKMTGRAYPLFQIAQLVLDKPERYAVQLASKKKNDGTNSQMVFICALDDSPWLNEDEAIAHVLKNHFATFYQVERTATEPPKGTYTFVAQCGMSGAILGPPNHHDYQNQLRKLHTERFSRMPFEAFKSRVKIVKDEAVVKKWIEDQSFKIEYTVLNVPEPLKLASMEEVEKHFRSVHREAIIKQAESHTIAGVPSRNLRNRELQRLIRREWEQQKYFPLQLATGLSKQFASHGLHFFKVNKTVTHVAVARPQFLDLAVTPVSENVKRIVEFINSNPKCTRRKLIESLAPAPAAPTVIEVKPEEKTPPTPPEPTPEQTALIADLHWLIHQGHVLEFADGRLETAKKPAPKPVKAGAKPAEEKPATETETTEQTPTEIPVAAEAAAVSTEPAPAVEAVPVQPETKAVEQTIPTENASPMAAESPAEPPNQIASEPPVS